MRLITPESLVSQQLDWLISSFYTEVSMTKWKKSQSDPTIRIRPPVLTPRELTYYSSDIDWPSFDIVESVELPAVTSSAVEAEEEEDSCRVGVRMWFIHLVNPLSCFSFHLELRVKLNQLIPRFVCLWGPPSSLIHCRPDRSGFERQISRNRL